MALAGGPFASPRARLLAWVVALLLFVRFIASSALVGVNLSPPTLVTVGAALETYEVVLPFLLLPVFFLFMGWRAPPISFRETIVILGLLGVALVVWILAILQVFAPVTTLVFVILGVAGVAAGSWVAFLFPPDRVLTMRPWTAELHRVFVVALPVVFAMRLASIEGFDPITGSSALRGNWFFVHVPTILLEFLVVALFVNVLFDRTRAELRKRWYAFLPFVLVPLMMDAVADRPLTGYILSAMITWGSNLALFSPAVVSLGLATGVFACFAASLLLLGRRAQKVPWELLLLGCASAVFAGFYPSMASVVGLDIAMVEIAAAIGMWPPRTV